MSTLDTDKLAPYSQEAEESLLGSILIGGRFEDIPDLGPADFFLVRNAWCFEAFHNLWKRGEQIDNITGRAELTALGYWQQIQDPGYLTYLINNCPTHLHLKTYAATVKEYAKQRQLLGLAGDLAKASLTGDRRKADLIIQQAQEILGPNGHGLRVTPAADLYGLPPQAWLIDSMVLSQGLNILFGPPGSGKSFIAVDWALRISQFETTVYIAGEGFAGYPDRVAAACNFYKLKDSKLFFVDKAVNLLDPVAVATLIRTLKPYRPVLVILDTLARCMAGGDENSARDMGLAIDAMDTIRRNLGTTILAVHHTPRATEARPRGHTSLEGAADCMIGVTEDETVITVASAKSKDSIKAENVYVRLMETDARPGRRSPVVLAAEKVRQTKEDKLTRGQLEVLQLLAQEIYAETGANWARLREVADKTPQSLSRILSFLKRIGHVRQADKGEPYFITESGKTIISGVTRVTSDSLLTPVSPESLESLTPPTPFRVGEGVTHVTIENSDSRLLAAGGDKRAAETRVINWQPFTKDRQDPEQSEDI